MSVELNTYVGPYFRFNDQLREQSYQESRCSKNECSNSQKKTKSNYCPICGNKTTSVTLTRTTDLNLYSLVEELDIDPDLFAQFDDLIIPNQDIEGAINEMSSDPFEINLDVVNSVNDIALWLNDPDYAEAFKKLDDAGIQYKVVFGVVTFYW